MLFRRKKSLKKEYDEKLLSEMEQLKQQWQTERDILDKSFDSNDELDKQLKLAELKYFYLFKEAKTRQLKISNKIK